MNSLTVRIDSKSHGSLRRIAKAQRRTMQDVLGEAVEAYRRKVFREQANAGYARIKKDPKVRRELEKELALWDNTLADGLDS